MSQLPSPPDPPQRRKRRHPFLTFLMVVTGAILLLPGICSLFFVTVYKGGDTMGLIALLWLICFIISAGGVYLIVRALR